MRRVTLSAALAAALVAGAAVPAARAGTEEEVRALYERFYRAQNARDLGSVRGLLLESDDFLWVSDGKSFWGPDTLVERMAAFQRFAVWRVEPLLDRARVVEVAAEVAYLHLPLDLAIGASEAEAAPFRWLVSMLCRRTGQGWRIAALFTTADNPAPSL
jgi:uncharacterized protein (TIGR02246 family)